MQGIGDTGQGAVNGLIFVLLTHEVQKKLFCCKCREADARPGFSEVKDKHKQAMGNSEPSVHVNAMKYSPSKLLLHYSHHLAVGAACNSDKTMPREAEQKKELMASEETSVYTPLSSDEP